MAQASHGISRATMSLYEVLNLVKVHEHTRDYDVEILT